MNEPTTLKRPKPGDGEVELFRMQEEFLKSRQAPSAKVINLRASSKLRNDEPSDDAAMGNAKTAGKIVSKFAQRKALQKQENNSRSPSGYSQTSLSELRTECRKDEVSLDPVANLPANPSTIVLGNIVEKKYSGQACRPETTRGSVSDGRDKGFPDVFLVDRKVLVYQYLLYIVLVIYLHYIYIFLIYSVMFVLNFLINYDNTIFSSTHDIFYFYFYYYWIL